MWHTLERVAEGRRIDPASFRAFVEYAHADKMDDYGMISTWDVDEIVNQYHNAILSANMADEIIEELA